MSNWKRQHLWIANRNKNVFKFQHHFNVLSLKSDPLQRVIAKLLEASEDRQNLSVDCFYFFSFTSAHRFFVSADTMNRTILESSISPNSGAEGKLFIMFLFPCRRCAYFAEANQREIVIAKKPCDSRYCRELQGFIFKRILPECYFFPFFTFLGGSPAGGGALPVSTASQLPLSMNIFVSPHVFN